MNFRTKRLNTTLAVVLLSGQISRPPSAQAYETITLHGVPISCTAASGRRVPLIISEEAQKSMGGFARIDPVRGPTLMLSPKYLNQLPRLAAFNLFYHECAHLALPMGIGLGNPQQESAADCYAVNAMRQHGLISSWLEFAEAMTYLKTLPASENGHLPGPERVKLAAQCAKLPIVANDETFCRGLDKVFTDGERFLNQYDFEKNQIFGIENKTFGVNLGWCSHESSKLYCHRNFENEYKGASFVDSLVGKISNCLTSDFKYEKGVLSKNWMWHSWTNNATGHSVFTKSDYSGAFSFVVDFPD